VRVATRAGEVRRYTLDPLLLRMVDDELYLFAWSHERSDTRTFKVARIVEATMREEPAGAHPEVVLEAAFRGAVKAWSGPLSRVRVRIRPAKAWLVDEYPLVRNQETVREGDGSAVVCAEVAGLVEAVRWVLSWGRDAEALDPVELREAVADELAETLAGYRCGHAARRRRARDDDQVRSSKVSDAVEAASSTTQRVRVGSPRRRKETQ
jgi:predicted DNA-binding transcriptional regulator YafY